MAVYGVTAYGAAIPQGYYGAPPLEYSVEPMSCAPTGYESILVNWSNPGGTIAEFRLIRNRAGFPVDENDGEILLDVDTLPVTSFLDTTIIPGTYHYYGVYVLVTIGDLFEWIRAGLTACLMPANYNSGEWLFNLLPVFYQENLDGELTQTNTTNDTLQQYLNVIGWGLDYLRTQYNLLLSANDPGQIAIGSLMNLSTELGLSYYPDVSQSVMQQMIVNAAHINKTRGTLAGIASNITQMTGWGADVTISKNIMLEQDHSYFADPDYDSWYPNRVYNVGERCKYQSCWFQCISSANWGHPPTGGNSSNTWWEPCIGFADQGELWNPRTGWRNCWEPRWPGVTNAKAPSGGVWAKAVIQEAGSPTTAATLYVQSVDMTAQKQQLLLNPDFAGTIYPWTTSKCTLAIDDLAGYAGESTLLTPTGSGTASVTSGITGVPSNCPVTVTALVYSPNGWSDVQLALSWYDSTQTLLSTSTSSNQSVPAGQWTTLTFTASAPQACCFQVIGCLDPLDNTSYRCHALCHVNTAGAAQALEMRTLSRLLTDMESGSSFADAAQVIQDGTPVPWTQPFNEWEEGTEYGPGVLVWWGNQSFVALKGSTGIEPPLNTNEPSNEWAPLGFDRRIMLTWSSYQMQTGSGSAIQAVPYAEWYDQWGNFLGRVTARNNGTSGTIPNNLYYDSFSNDWGNSIASRAPEVGTNTWTQETGTLEVTGFDNGTAAPTSPSTRSYAIINAGVSNTMLGVTIKTSPQSGYACGLIARWSNDTNYWRIDQEYITLVSSGSKSHVATHSTPFAAGDRMTVSMNGSTISVFRNAGTVAVSTYSSSFNSSATSHGIINELI